MSRATITATVESMDLSLALEPYVRVPVCELYPSELSQYVGVPNEYDAWALDTSVTDY